ncbi:hypothetical protein F2Q70_00017156 [Brassica cretica]|uniref:Uncharacterized protein n=1 Tax=Brassica cretica TaxID=69181 RepID=A0A8S9HSA3_BRACR|nr:hypothetical protein F2Q70_00017156 [Brassica cretica]
MAENSNGDQISEVKETSDSVHAFMIGDKQVRFTDEKITFAEKPPEAEKVTINLDEGEDESEEDVEIDRQEGNNVDRLTTVNIDRQNENNVD